MAEEMKEDFIYTLTDEETGIESNFELLASCELDGKVYFALQPEDSPEEYVILRRELDDDGEEMLITIEDDEEFDRVADLFDDEFSDFDYDGDGEDEGK